MEYSYYVSFWWVNKGNSGLGCTEVNRQIKNFDDIKKITTKIKNEIGCEEVIIINWKKYGE